MERIVEKVEKITEVIESRFPGYNVKVNPVHKNNVTKTGITIGNFDENGTMFPTFYLENYKTVEELMEAITFVLSSDLPEVNVSVLQNPDNIFYCIIGKHNTEMLSDVIYSEIPDTNLVKLYRVLAGQDKSGIKSAIIRKSIAETNGWSDDFIFKKGEENTPKLFQPKVMDLSAMFGFPGLEETKMDVLSNQTGINGAAALFYPDIMDKILLPEETRAVVLPSSIHEVIVVHGTEIETTEDYSELHTMVTSINGNPDCIQKEDILTNSIYLYTKEDGLKEIIF